MQSAKAALTDASTKEPRRVRGFFFAAADHPLVRRALGIASHSPAADEARQHSQSADDDAAVDLRLDARWMLPIVPADSRCRPFAAGRRRHGSSPSCRRRDAERDYTAREHVALPTHVLHAGARQCAHVHAAMTLMRGIADDVPLEPWLRAITSGRAKAALSTPTSSTTARCSPPRRCCAAASPAATTCISSPTPPPRAYRASGMRAMLGLPVLDFPTPYAADADGYLHAGLAARDAWKHEPRLRFSLAPHAPYTVGDASWAKIVIYARQLDLPIQTHLLEDARRARAERRRVRRRRRCSACIESGRDRSGLHRDPRGPARRRRHRPARDAALPRRALPDVESQARQRHRAGHGAQGARRQRRARHRWRGQQQPPRRVRRGAPRLAARQGRNRRRRGARRRRRAAHGDARRRSGAGARRRDRIARSRQAGRRHRRRPGAVEHAPCYDPVSHLVHVTGRDQVSDVWVAGRAPRRRSRADAHRRTRPRVRAPAIWQDRLQ